LKSAAVREPSSQIDEAAAAWALRAQAGALSPSQDAAFALWIQADARHLGAYTKAMAVLAHFDMAAALKRDRGRGVMRGPQVSRRGWLQGTGALAAGVTAAVFAGEWASGAKGRAATRKGEVQMLALKDGSHMTLDTSSAAQVAFGPTRRSVRLLSGEAMFDVAKDAARPFIVLAGGAQVRAIGTSFSVRLAPDGQVQVLVQEGVVAVTRASPGARPRAVQLSANMSTLAGGGDAPLVAVAVPPDMVERRLAWRNGMLDFDDTSLEQAAAQFARYSDYDLTIDPVVADERISGRFSTGDPKGFAKAAATSLGLRVRQTDTAATLYR
jgi:transmembrane sensor